MSSVADTFYYDDDHLPLGARLSLSMKEEVVKSQDLIKFHRQAEVANRERKGTDRQHVDEEGTVRGSGTQLLEAKITERHKNFMINFLENQRIYLHTLQAKLMTLEKEFDGAVFTEKSTAELCHDPLDVQLQKRLQLLCERHAQLACFKRSK